MVPAQPSTMLDDRTPPSEVADSALAPTQLASTWPLRSSQLPTSQKAMPPVRRLQPAHQNRTNRRRGCTRRHRRGCRRHRRGCRRRRPVYWIAIADRRIAVSDATTVVPISYVSTVSDDQRPLHRDPRLNRCQAKPVPVIGYFTPCGEGCADVRMQQVGSTPYGQARFLNGQWTLDGPRDTVCQDGTTRVPNAQTVHFTWDPNTLAGTAQITEKVATCGASVPESWTDNLQLKKAP